MTSTNAWIGRRVARLRDLKGMSQTQLAEAVGVSQPYISQIESGKKAVVTRRMLLRLADVLDVPNAVLLGQPLPATAREDLVTLSALAGIRAALDYPDEPVAPRAREFLAALTRSLMVARMECDYATLGAGLPAQLAETRAAYDRGSVWAGEMLVRGLVTGSLALRPIGWQDLAMRLAELARRVAAELGQPAMIAAAEFAHAQGVLASGSHVRAMDLAATAAQEAPSGDPEANAWRGLLHLHAALSASSYGARDVADGHLDEADRVARHDEYRDAWFMEFSPPNVAVWRMSTALESGDDVERAGALSIFVDRDSLRTRNRLCRVEMETGRAFYAAERPDAAVRSFLRAFEIAPDEVRPRSTVREIVGQIRRDAVGGGSTELRRLVDLMGLASAA